MRGSVMLRAGALLALAASAAIACGGGAPERVPEPAAPHATYPPGTRIGIPLVDRIVGAVTLADTRLGASLWTSSRLPCGDRPEQPVCPPATPEGTRVEVVSVVECQVRFVESARAREEFAAFVAPGAAGRHLRLYAVVEAPVSSGARAYMVIFSDGLALSRSVGTSLDGIRFLSYGCGAPSAPKLLEELPPDFAVVFGPP